MISMTVLSPHLSTRNNIFLLLLTLILVTVTECFRHHQLSLSNPHRATSSALPAAKPDSQRYRTNKRRPRNKFPISNTSPEDLTLQISGCRNNRELCDIIRKNSNLFFVNDAVRALSQKVVALKPIMTRRDLAFLLNTLSHCRTPPAARNFHNKLMFTLSELARKQHLKSLSEKDISMILNALSKRNVKNDDLFELAGERATSMIGTFTSQGLALTLNAYAKMGYESPALFEAVADVAIPILDNFNSQDLANTVNAYAKMEYESPALFEAVADAAIPILGTFTSQALANTVNAYAKMEYESPALFEAVADVAMPMLDTFNSHELAITVNAYAKMGYESPALFEAVADVAMPMLDTFDSQNLANTVNAYAKMEYESPALFEAVADAAIPILGTFTSQALANTVNAYAKMGYESPALFEAVADVAMPMLDTFNSHELAITVNAYAKMGYESPALFEAVADVAMPMLDTFDSQDLANTVAAYAKLRHNCTSTLSLFQNCANTIKSKSSLVEWEPEELSGVAYAFMKAQNYDPELLDVLGKELLLRNETFGFDSRFCGNLAAAFSYRDSKIGACTLKLIFQKWQELDKKQIALESVADVVGSIPAGQRMGIVPSGFAEELAELAIEKCGEARMEDVRDILIRYSKMENLDDELYEKLLAAYAPLLTKFISQMNSKRVQEIRRFYAVYPSWETVEQ